MRKTLQASLAAVAGMALVPGLLTSGAASASAPAAASEAAPTTTTGTQMAPTARPTIPSMSEYERHLNWGKRVKAVEYLLYYRGMLSGSYINEKFTKADGNATLKWQRKYGSLADDRIAGNMTVLYLAPNLYSGNKNTAVKAAQTLLKYHGFNPGAIDGSFGSSTKTALNNFLRAAGSSHRNSIGDSTWAMLFQKQGTYTGGGSAEDRAVPLSQLGTGPDEYMNCGPTSVVNSLIALGKTPDGWTGSVSSRKSAVMKMRVRMNDDGKAGTTLLEVRRGLYKYGVKYDYQYNSGSNMAAFDKALAAVRADDDHIAILHGSANYWRSGPNMGHYVSIVGYNSSTGRYQMIDPATPQGSQGVRNVTKSQIYAFGRKRGLPNAVWTR